MRELYQKLMTDVDILESMAEDSTEIFEFCRGYRLGLRKRYMLHIHSATPKRIAISDDESEAQIIGKLKGFKMAKITFPEHIVLDSTGSDS